MAKKDAPSDGVTARQWQYLFYLHTRRGPNRTVSACAAHFGISRQGANKVFAILEDKGLVLRADDDAIALTPSARDGLRPLTEQCEEIEVFLQGVGHAAARARDEAIRMIHTLPSDTIRFMTAKFLADRVLAPSSLATDEGIAALPDGIYPIHDFVVYKGDGDEISMGNNGFRRPVMFVAARGAYGLEIRAKTIRHALPSGKVMQGTLTRLGYFKDGAHAECSAFCERWAVPAEALTLTRAGDGFVCRMRFWGDAGPACRMPMQSEGRLVFTVSADSERLPFHTEAKRGRAASARGAKARG
jgi:Mn-dependent DtxR family transcriptional regulator